MRGETRLRPIPPLVIGLEPSKHAVPKRPRDSLGGGITIGPCSSTRHLPIYWWRASQML